MNDTEFQKRAKAWHAHLDVCKQCRDHPFQLCPEGAKLLQHALSP